MVLKNQMWSLKSPWEVLKKWLQLFLWTLLEFSLIFTVPNLLICQKKISESVPADSTLIYDWKLELSWDVHFFIRTRLRMTGIQTLKFLLVPFKKGNGSLSALSKNFQKGQNFIPQKNPNRPIWKPIIFRGRDKNWTFHRQRIKSEQKLLIDP